MYSIYVLKSVTTARIYIGQTGDLVSRIKRHNRYKRGSYTSFNKGPWMLVYKEEFQTKHEALRREKYLKSHSGRDWLRSIIAM